MINPLVLIVLLLIVVTLTALAYYRLVKRQHEAAEFARRCSNLMFSRRYGAIVRKMAGVELKEGDPVFFGEDGKAYPAKGGREC